MIRQIRMHFCCPPNNKALFIRFNLDSMPLALYLSVKDICLDSVVLCMPQNMVSKPESSIPKHHTIAAASAYTNNTEAVPCMFDSSEGHPRIARAVRGPPKLTIQRWTDTTTRYRDFNY